MDGSTRIWHLIAALTLAGFAVSRLMGGFPVTALLLAALAVLPCRASARYR